MDPTQPTPVTSPPPAAPNDKQQIVEQIRNGKNVLVTVGNNPSVDELAAALGLTFMLGKLEKHATAVFSGNIPPAISFLDPESTFESTVDSLRDFIIALDKDKADKLRYKVEDDVVKVFITPYKTVLKKDDFKFSQGDLNVDVVVAIGVKKQDELDKAITSHGRILHDAAVVSINAGEQAGDLGSVNWNDPAASSVSEMLVSISESFGSGLLDEQISTAYLTGIVAETNRFSNEKTSPKVMTMAAQLMAAGANQQLIASNLRQEGMISEPIRKKQNQPKSDSTEMVLSHDKKPKGNGGKPEQKSGNQGNRQQSQPKSPDKAPDNQAKQTKSDAGTSRKSEGQTNPSANQPAVNPPKSEPKPAAQLPAPPAGPPPLPQPTIQPSTPAPAAGLPQITPEPLPEPAPKPNFGGTLNATTSNAEADREAEAKHEAETNSVALEHNSGQPDDAVEAARRAVEDAALESSPQPALSQNPPTVPDTSPSEPLPAISHNFTPPAPVTPPEPSPASDQSSESSPVDAFMQPHTPSTQPLTFAANEDTALPFGATAGPQAANPAMPPLPPLPSTPSGGLPPMPPLPGQSTPTALPGAGPAPSNPSDPTAGFQPQINPGFMQDMPQSQNQWTDAGQDMAAKQVKEQSERQAKMDQMTAQYDQAVEKNQQLKQQATDDHSTFPLPR